MDMFVWRRRWSSPGTREQPQDRRRRTTGRGPHPHKHRLTTHGPRLPVTPVSLSIGQYSSRRINLTPVMLLVVAARIRRCTNIHGNEVKACRFLCSERRSGRPSFSKLTDVIRERMDVESVRSEERQAGRPVTDSQTAAAAAVPVLRNVRNQESDARTVLQSGVKDVRQEQWLTVYRFPHIVAVRVFCRFKIYQTFLTVAFSLLYVFATSHSAGLFTATGVSVFATGVLYVVGNILRRVVGVLYLSPDHTMVKIAHMNFWGKREDHVFDVKYIVPLTESPESKGFRQLFISDPGFADKYYLLSMKGVIPDPQVFADTFGIDVPGAENADAGEDEAKEKRVKDE